MRRLAARLFSLLLVLAGLACAWLVWYAGTPMDQGTAGYPLTFALERGSSLKAAANSLARAGAVERAWAFVLLARLQGRAAAIKAGSYALEKPATPLELLRKITEGETVLGKLTVIEGWTFAEMRRAVNAHPGIRHDSANLSDDHLLAAIGADSPHAEGRFFPDTYFFDLGSSDLALFKRAHQAMRGQLEAAWAGRDPNLPYRSSSDALIMASIIEKETGAPEERAQIAAVFINRLRIGMRLQTDPTVIYGLGARFDGNLRKGDLLDDTPYNTYTRAGLPPTPIALPGADALRAAVHPEASRALYFVAKGNGRHVFSDNLEAHNRAVARYQKGR